MGTSSIYRGPIDNNPLLPKDFDPNKYEEEQEQQEKEPLAPWKSAKSSMSQYINESHGNRGRILRSYTRALGGASTAASSARSGIKSAISLGRFLSSVSSEGIINTLQSLSVNFKGKEVEELFSTLVNVLVPESSLKEDAIARKASIEALSQLYELVEQNNMDINTLDSLNPEFFDTVMATFISSYIFERLLNDLESRFEQYATDSLLAIEKETEVKEYIVQHTDVRLREINFKNIDYNQSKIENVFEGIYRECYEVLEDYL
ncbi:Qat anti-phage system associated protein QatB [Niallia circulans]|uniref:Uncharacterized protein n=1 Tax=Niallia circulans TaxID=1397 RepID=A0A941JMG6_NIACI|nr:Qat anti-phage system associated protein QatB [Niallia circulans]MCB5237162.1 hypothetical protein [Niallia circulans]